MKSFTLLSLAAAAMALPQSNSNPAGCSSTVPGTFQITTVLLDGSSTKRSLEARQLDGPLTITLTDGVLKDQAGRQGNIVANYQFQFDNPLQSDALVLSGFALCGNNSLAVLQTTVFFQCLSGDFYNLYSKSIRSDCIPINIMAVNFSNGPAAPAPAATSAAASQAPDGQPRASSAASRVVTQIPDGQPQASSAARVVSQIPDGQPQASRPVSRVITQISDGQPQASRPVSRVITQISDGQPQASRPASVSRVITQISDGQPQASRPVITQISDGQPQASRPASVSRVITQISDGQPQASRPVVTQISDGQPQASRPAVATFTGAAAPGAGSVGALAAGIFGLLALV